MLATPADEYISNELNHHFFLLIQLEQSHLEQRQAVANTIVAIMLRSILVPLLCLAIASVESHKKHKEYNRFSIDVLSDPPPPDQAANMARYIVHNADWASVATISTIDKIKTFPFANIYSVSDGLISKGTGTPYLYMTPMSMTVQDLRKDSRSSLTMTLAQGDYCKKQSLDPEDPRCAHVILTGKIMKIENGTVEALVAENALFTRHPIMRTWPKGHEWYFAKLKVDHICVMDYFGGPKFVKVKDYFVAD